MTRTHKANEVPHNHPEAEAAFGEHAIPKFFGKTGPTDRDLSPNKIKKNGAGKCNWGIPGDEIEDLLPEVTTFNARRRSNSKGHVEEFVRSKFESHEDYPVFEENVHGPGVEEGAELAPTTSNDSTQSVQGEKA